MQTLTEALSDVAAGWSPDREIIDRAILMRGHAKDGHMQRAEEYAVEIEALQAALFARTTKAAGFGFPRVMLEGESEWKLSHMVWANILMHGVYCERGIWASAECDAETVAGRARYRFAGSSITACDVIPPADLRKVVAA